MVLNCSYQYDANFYSAVATCCSDFKIIYIVDAIVVYADCLSLE